MGYQEIVLLFSMKIYVVGTLRSTFLWEPTTCFHVEIRKISLIFVWKKKKAPNVEVCTVMLFWCYSPSPDVFRELVYTFPPSITWRDISSEYSIQKILLQQQGLQFLIDKGYFFLLSNQRPQNVIRDHTVCQQALKWPSKFSPHKARSLGVGMLRANTVDL